MPGEQSDPFNNNSASAQRFSGADLYSIIPRLSPKAGLTVFLSVGLLSFLLSQYNYLLIHTLIELSSIVLLTAL